MERVQIMEYKALSLDLDGTLMDSDKKLSDVNKAAIWAAIDAGTSVILASGRPVFGVTPVAEALELDKRGGYILAYNGGNIIDCKTGKRIYEKMIPQECVDAICKAGRENGVYALTYYEDKIVAESDTDEYVIKEAFCNNAQIMKVDDLSSFVDYEVAKFLVVGEHTKLLPVKDKLMESYGEVLDIFFSEEYFLEIVPKNVAKDISLNALLNILNIDKSQLIACGDGMNDMSMIKYAGLGVAMENAYPPVKECADYIAPSNDADGVAQVIEKFILLKKTNFN